MTFFHDLASIGKLTMSFWCILMFKVFIVIYFLEPSQLNLLNSKHCNLLNACEIKSKFIENFDSEFQDDKFLR
jgi:hypothetical protein